MSSNGVQPFENNWAYLKTELRWLDRMLMMAVARKRQDDKAVHHVSSATVDQITSHWWKGIITVNRGIDDREGPPPKRHPQAAPNQASYSQQLQLRVQAAQQASIVLALPSLRDRLQLSEVEKNLVLMAIAPEINRRYGRLYDYLQEEEGALADLPTVDLCLRLLCRNDQDWQQARTRLTASHSLVNRGLLEWIGDEDGTLLSQQVRVSDALANFLLADYPTAATLEALLASSALAPVSDRPEPSAVTASQSPSTAFVPLAVIPDQPMSVDESAVPIPAIAPTWNDLVLPKAVIRQLQYLGRQAIARHHETAIPGFMVLLVGAPGTGKTTAAQAIASDMQVPLSSVELETLTPEDYPDSLTASPSETCSLLLVKQGELWFGRQSQVETPWLHQWWQWRLQFGLTLVVTTAAHQVLPHWRQKFDAVLTLPRPNVKARQQLWERAFAPKIKTHQLDWRAIAQQLPLTGGEICTLAQTIELDLQSRQRATVTLASFRAALALHYPHLEVTAAAKAKAKD
ncbi:AAA family ATPase [Halomicronema sp. CCY15110]|uniref:AAA family ATPase n=1 Tax=Halomicronema sp. CCY15110 TaxID=2767773 RepID=UPI00194E5AE6|nr:AAA family ATPase [Halomicronema sp. CCY15110]